VGGPCDLIVEAAVDRPGEEDDGGGLAHEDVHGNSDRRAGQPRLAAPARARRR
jgi:hypothetical protein